VPARMPLSEPVKGCLLRLTSLCEDLEAQAESLRSENKSLRARLASLSECKSAERAEAELQATVKLPQALTDSALTEPEARDADGGPQAEPPGTIPQSPTSPGTQPPAIAAFASRFRGKSAVSAVSDLSEARSSCARTEAGAEPTPSVQEAAVEAVQSLAAARLGMLGAAEDHHEEEHVPLTLMFDTLAGFNEEDDNKGPLLYRIVHSVQFRALCIAAIAANTLYIGVAADHQVKNSYRRIEGVQQEPSWTTADLLFTVWFAVELLMRMAADKRAFLCGDEYKWNWFDGFLVLNSAVEIIWPISANLSFLRILRVFRVVRVVRVVRTVKALKSLRTMVFALLNSFVCLMWAFVMIVIIMFVFGIIFDNAVAGYFDYLDVNNEMDVANAMMVHTYFGTLYETMVSLFCAITSGNDWMVYAELLRLLDHGEFYFAIFAFYVAFCMVGMLNVVTGIFVDSAVCTRTEDEVVECFKEDEKRTSEEVKRIFKEADKDNSGTLSFQELARHLENPWVKAYFSGLDIDPSEAGIIFTLIDTDGSDSVSIDEFVDGTMKLKGHAKSIDVLSMMFDNVRFMMKFGNLCNFIEEHIRDIKQAVAPDAAPVGPVLQANQHADKSSLTSAHTFARMRFTKGVSRRSGIDRRSAPPTMS